MFRFYKHLPQGIWQLNVIQFFSTTGFAVLLGTLNLYLQKRGLPLREVNTLTASFFALNFLFHFLGATLGGWLISYRGLFCISLILQFLGLLGIMALSVPLILIGMGFFVVGTGLNVTCLYMMLTHRFTAEHTGRRTAFSLAYIAMNMGFLLSFSIANIFQSGNHYRGAFLFALVCLLIALCLHLASWRYLADVGTRVKEKSKVKGVITMGIIVACLVVTDHLMHHPRLASHVVYSAFALGAVAVLTCALRSEGKIRRKMWVYSILISATMVYAFIQGLVATALPNFIKYNTTQSFLGVHIEPSGFNVFEALSVIIISYFFAKWLKKRQQLGEPVIPSQTLISHTLFFNVCAFVMIPVGIWVMRLFALPSVLLVFPIFFSIFAAFAEVGVNITAFSLSGELIPRAWQGLFTGYLFLNVAVGVNLSGLFSNAILGQYTELKNINPMQTNPMYLRMFLVVTGIALLATIAYRWIELPLTQLRQKN